MKSHIPNLLATALVAFLGAFVFIVLYQLRDNDPVLEVLSAPVTYKNERLSSTFAPGETMTVAWHYKRYRDCPTHYHRTVENSIIHFLRSGFLVTAPLGEHTTMGDIIIPHGLPPGEYEYRLKTTFVCNEMQRFRPLHYNFPPVPFTVKMDKEYLLRQHKMYEQQQSLK